MNQMISVPGVTLPAGKRAHIFHDISNEDYHASQGVSKSGLWTIENKSPAHYKFAEPVETTAFDFGEAAHFAILQPELFEAKVYRGPADRRGNKWKDADEFCKSVGKVCLTAEDYDGVLTIRDAVHADPWINGIITGGEGVNEASGYWIDDETGELCRCRPDRYRPDLKLILDVKSTANAHPDAFAKSVINFGYHAQEAWYTDGWNACHGAARAPDSYIKAESADEIDQEIKGASATVEAFAFLCFEKKAPFAYAVYELPPSIVAEGRAIMRKALTTYTECKARNRWPAYGEGVQELSFKRWSYRLTAAPDALDEEVAA